MKKILLVFVFICFGTVAVSADSADACPKGFYKVNGNCTACPNYMTTDGTGKTSVEDCKHYFQYGTNKTWAWPDAVTSVKFYKENIK